MIHPDIQFSFQRFGDTGNAFELVRDFNLDALENKDEEELSEPN